MFDALAKLSSSVPDAYQRAFEFKDLHPGDLHFVKINGQLLYLMILMFLIFRLSFSQIHTHTHTHTFLCIYAYMFVHSNTHSCAFMHTCLYIHIVHFFGSAVDTYSPFRLL